MDSSRTVTRPPEHFFISLSPNRANWTSQDLAALQSAAKALQSGQLVAFPTETVYGLGGLATDPDAVARIFAAKQRPSNNPLIVHATGLPMLEQSGLIQLTPELEHRIHLLSGAFWPGPLTIIVPRGPRASDLLTAGSDTVAIRIPDHPVALELLRRTGAPVAAPSANRSTRLSPTTASHVLNSLDPADLAHIVDGGPCAIGIESTVLDITGSQNPRVLRPGLITPSEIASRLSLPVLAPEDITTPKPGSPNLSPGMLADHYQPHIPLVLLGSDWTKSSHPAAADWILIEAGTPLVTPDPDHMLEATTRSIQLTLHPPSAPVRALIQLPSEADAFGRELYSALHIAQESGVMGILVAPLPAGESWLAVRDRLRRAATKHRPTIDSVGGLLPWHF